MTYKIYIKTIIIIFFSFCFKTAYCQFDGYKNLIIGQKSNFESLRKIFKIKQIADRGYRLKGIEVQTFCDIKISHVDFQINNDSLITLVQLYTVDSVYYDDAAYSNSYKSIGECVVSTVGAFDHFDPGVDRADGRMTMSWIFADRQKILALYGNSISIYEHNAKRNFLIAWAERPKDRKMW